MSYETGFQETVRTALLRIEMKVDTLLDQMQTAQSQPLEREYLGVYELSLLLKVSQKTIYNWVYKERIPYTKINGRLLFARREMEAFARARSNPL